MSKAYVLSEDDKKALSILNQLVKQGKLNITRGYEHGKVDHEEHQAPEIYVAKTPSAGIPAITQTNPGKADCEIYRLIPAIGSDGEADLEEVPNHEKTVYNISGIDIEGDVYVLVSKEKYGSWVVGPPGDAGFWGRITHKTPGGGGEYTRYQFTRVHDSVDPRAITWLDGELTGIAFEVNNIDLPVYNGEVGTAADHPPLIVWLRKGENAIPGFTGTGTLPEVTGTGTGSGRGETYYLFDQQPRWEFVEKLGVAGEDGYADGVLLRWDQPSDSWISVESVYIIDANATP